MPILRWTLAVLAMLLGGATAISRAAEPDPEKPLVTILFTAETHAALLPCDCPLQPLGGVARRATLIQRCRQRGPVVLVDAGGWAAGGIYDEESDGDPSRDRLRSDLMAKAMKAMQYDFFVPGPLEAAYDSEPLRPAQPVLSDPALAPFESEAVKVLVTGWSEPGTKALGRTAPALPAEITNSASLSRHVLRVHLSRLGEERCEELARVSGADLIVNAGRKTSSRASWRSGHTVIANFDYQAQRLGIAEVFPLRPGSPSGADTPRFDVRVRFEPLTAAIPDDPAVAALLQPNLETLRKTAKKRVEIEYWMMPECPGSEQALPLMQQLVSDLSKRAAVTPHFVLHKEDGKLGSLHGERELNEARLEALIIKHYPDRIWAWLAWRQAHRGAPWQDGARELGLLAARLRGALASGEADALLEADYELMLRRQVDASPSLVIANRVYDGPLERPHVLRVLCGLLESPSPAACKDVPACFFDAQCRKRGFIGKCIDPGLPSARCDQSRPALKVAGTVITDRENMQDNHERILEILVGDLPGLEYRVLDCGDAEARSLIEKGKLARLPAYLLDPSAQKEVNYAESAGRAARLNEALNLLVLQPFATGAHRVLGRPRIKGRLDLFASRFSKNGQEAVECALDYLKTCGPAAPEVLFHDVLYWKETENRPGERELAAAGGLPEVEEAARALAVKKIAPEKFQAYLLERGKRRAGSYWDVPLRTLGIDAAQVRALAEEPSGEIVRMMHAEAGLLKSLDAGGEIVVLAENCELLPVRSRADLRSILDRLRERKSSKEAR